MSDQNMGKKMVEGVGLEQFLDAYAVVTGTPMAVVSSGESPDFICARPNGKQVGIELARSSHDYHSAKWDKMMEDRVMSARDLLDAVNITIEQKRRKIKSAHWRTPYCTILVVQLLDYTFDSLAWTKERSLSNDYARMGFLEIWIADYSTLEAFDEVRLTGLYPPEFWGCHDQPALKGKPYG